MRDESVDRRIEEVGLPQAASELRVAGVVFTYRCTIRCRHCMFGCAGDRPDVAMSPRQCADALAMLHETGRMVHVAGGEAMLYWETLAASLRLAHAEGHAPHFIETNCSFASDDAIVRERFAFLRAHGVRGVLASADPFHQESVPPENFLRVRRVAYEVFGERHFYGRRAPDDEIRVLAEIARDDARRCDYVRRHPPQMVGAAHRFLARCLDAFALDDPALPHHGWRGPVAERHCLAQFRAETLWELHVDPYGNIQTNCGIILGHVERVRPAALLAAGPERANRFVETVCAGGPWALAALAEREHGFRPPERVVQGCELCFLARSFLRPFHPEVFGPAEIY